MEQFLDYYNFESFRNDISGYFNQITFVPIREDYYLLIEFKNNTYTVHLTTYDSVDDIGIKNPTGINTLIEDFKLDNNDHRRIIQKYLDFN